ncbi:MAG: DegV domain-containing protein/M5005_Spy1226 [Chloroflexi bacterium ADurb.Bin180]|nr:MAG: DegV domain-containing protein/M5005_Spy1226 [Chloroflexi bacterium ADurb.Bin180]
MSKIAIVTDTGMDLTPQQTAELGIHVVPLMVTFGTETFPSSDLSIEDYWARVKAGGRPGTSQPPTGLYEQVYRQLVEAGQQVLCLAITSKHSGTFNSAWLAAQNFPGQVTVFDTLSLALAQAYQAITAARMAREGASMEAILQRLESIRARTHFVIALDTIESLRRGGRADQIIPVLERVVRVLSIKPLLEIRDGQLKLLGAARSREKSHRQIIDELAKHTPVEAAMVCHTRSADIAPAFAAALAARLGVPVESIPIAETGAILASHAGPGVMAAGVIQAER